MISFNVEHLSVLLFLIAIQVYETVRGEGFPVLSVADVADLVRDQPRLPDGGLNAPMRVRVHPEIHAGGFDVVCQVNREPALEAGATKIRRHKEAAGDMMGDDDLVGGPACLDGCLDERQIELMQAVVSRPCTA